VLCQLVGYSVYCHSWLQPATECQSKGKLSVCESEVGLQSLKV